MITEIYTQNGQVLHISRCRSLTQDKIADKDGSDALEQFMARVYERLELQVIPRELDDIGLDITLLYYPYEDET